MILYESPKKLALISSMAGFGRCSMTVAIPVISALRVQACPVPTSIFSNHTAFPSWYVEDYTSKIPAYLQGWEALSLHFDGIYSSFLGSVTQAEIVRIFIQKQRSQQSDVKVIIDPVMGDHGKTYATITPELCHSIKQLVLAADLITPNLTEACLLTDTDYHTFQNNTDDSCYYALLTKLSKLGPQQIVITGIKRGNSLCNFVYDHGIYTLYEAPIRGEARPGTGDIFASIISACSLRNIPFIDAIKAAADFIGKCTNASHEAGIPVKEGVCFEYFLSDLCYLSESNLDISH